METWWNGLGTPMQVYYGIAIVSTAVVLFQLMLSLLGSDGGHDAGDADVGGGTEHPGGLHLISVRTVTAFFVGFGWTGVSALQRGVGQPWVIAWASLAGCVFVAVVFYLMKSLYGLRHSGTLDYRNAVGQVGTVYLPVPANQAGSGQIEVMIQGRLVVAQAMTRALARLENRSKVRVVDVVGPTGLLVEPLAAGKG